MSTNGTLITPPAVARRLRDAGIGYAGISLDGGATAATHDAFRGGVPGGSFDRSVQALQNCIDAGLRCGVRFTVTKRNHNELGDLIALARSIGGVHRFCVYWLVPTGRGGGGTSTPTCRSRPGGRCGRSSTGSTMRHSGPIPRRWSS
ncbi:radical SAM protein [Methanoculleus chikugoensis]|uniref:radical SAM protein n=1 Tax=Methanoculleus chikugoensis TaxID=118126 RepID=UPI001FB4043D|nr:radical SAM protein [Methanoculleus chikugoensis]